MKTAERFICLIIALVFVFALSLNVFAAQEPIDTEKKASLRVRFLDGEKALSGAEFRLYMIADIDEDGNLLIGSIVICKQRAKEQAEEYGHTYERELHYLFVHGVMHCLGYDHITDEERAEMREREEKVLAKLGITRG